MSSVGLSHTASALGQVVLLWFVGIWCMGASLKVNVLGSIRCVFSGSHLRGMLACYGYVKPQI